MLQAIQPGVHVKRVRNVPPSPVRIDVAAFIGIAQRGPVDRIEVIEGWPQFVKTYGEFVENAFLAYTVRGFFDNGGLRCHILRVTAPALETNTVGLQPADRESSDLANTDRVRSGAVATLIQSSTSITQGVQPTDRKHSIVNSVAGMKSGNIAILQQTDVKPLRLEIVEVDSVAKSILWNEPLPAEFDLTQPVTISSTARDERLVASVSGTTVSWTRPLDERFDFNKTIHVGFGAAVASTFLYDETGSPIITIEASNPGRWGNQLSVQINTRFTSEYYTRQRTVPDPNNQLSLDRAEGLKAGALLEISQDDATTQRVLLKSINVDDLQVMLDTPLVGFDPIAAADGSKPISLRHLTATMLIREAGRLIETHQDIDLPPPWDPTTSKVNDLSNAIRISRLPGTADRWIDPASPLIRNGRVQLTSGRDGIAMLQASDFTGVVGQPPTGLARFAERTELAAIAMPDIMLPEIPAREKLEEENPLPDPCDLCPGLTLAPPLNYSLDSLIEATPAFLQATIEGIQYALIEHCELSGDCVALLDPPITAAGECLDWPDLDRWRQQFDSSYAVCYQPWIDIADPLDRTGRRLRRIPPSGHALGQFALADRDTGRAAPANRRLEWTAATACKIDDTRHAMLNERGINAITARPGRGIRIMGARTMSSHPDWKQLTVRRLFIRLKRAFRRELAWAVFEPANRFFEQRVIATLESLLELEWQAGRLRGARAEDAFQVIIERTTAEIDNGEFIIIVAIAPSLPAEFVFLRLSFTLDAMNLAELTGTGGWPA